MHTQQTLLLRRPYISSYFIRPLIALLFSGMLLGSCSSSRVANSLPSKKYDYLVELSTEFGTVHLVLFDETPQHKANFIKLIGQNFYDSCQFHRVLDNFMIQGGDPNSKPSSSQPAGSGGPGYTIPAEFVEGLVHDQGVLAAARKGDRANPSKASSGSQFYIVENEDGAHHLDGQYTIFGKVVKGIEVVEKIAEQPVNMRGRPSKPIWMKMKFLIMKKKEISSIYSYSYPES